MVVAVVEALWHAVLHPHIMPADNRAARAALDTLRSFWATGIPHHYQHVAGFDPDGHISCHRFCRTGTV